MAAPGTLDWRVTLSRRIRAVAVVLAVWVAAIEVRLVFLQVIEHADLVARAERQQLRTQPVPPKRGDILDRRGRDLSQSVRAIDRWRNRDCAARRSGARRARHRAA